MDKMAPLLAREARELSLEKINDPPWAYPTNAIRTNIKL